jgi:hypothetical protein
MLEKDREDDFEISCKKWSSITHSQGRKKGTSYIKLNEEY